METFRYKSYSCNFIIFCYIFYLEKIYCYSEHIWIKMLLKFIFYVFLDPSDRVLHNYYLSKNSKLNENLSRTEKNTFFQLTILFFHFSILCGSMTTQTAETLKGGHFISFYLWESRSIENTKLLADWNIIYNI